MATAKKSSSLKTFSTTIQLDNLQVGVDVQANTLEEALAIARDFKIEDVISFDGHDHIDSQSPNLIGIYTN